MLACPRIEPGAGIARIAARTLGEVELDRAPLIFARRTNILVDQGPMVLGLSAGHPRHPAVHIVALRTLHGRFQISNQPDGECGQNHDRADQP